MKHPDEFKDPTFTPRRDEAGHFNKVPPPPVQKKSKETDPDWDKLNPDIVALCQRNGMARSCLNLYLEGHLTWMESLETMVVALGKELLANQKIHVETQQEYVALYNKVKKDEKLALKDKNTLNQYHLMAGESY